MIFVYGDDGADEKRERVTAIGIIAGFEDWWQETEQAWVDRCNGIPFHAKDCESDFGDYRNRSHEENKSMYRDLTTLLVQSRLGGIGVAIDLLAHKRIFPGTPHSEQLAYHKAFLDVMNRAGSLAENIGEVAEMTFDVSTENEYNAALMYEVIRQGEPELIKWLHPKISFVPARESPRVQMADLLTYEAWKALDHTVGPIKRKRKSWQALRDTGRFETLSFSEEWFLDLKRDIQSGNLGKKVQFNYGDYQQWLKDKGRAHNMSNILRFIDWIRKRDEAV